MADETTVVKNDLNWLKQHEHIVIVSLLLLSFIWFVNKWLNNSAAKASQQLAVLQQQLSSEKESNAKIDSERAQIYAQYQNMVQTYQQQNAALAAAVAQRNLSLSNQQNTNKTLPLPDLAKRWELLVDLQPGDLTATDSGITVNDTAAVETVNQLEEVKTLQSNLNDETTIAQTTQKELTEANTLIASNNNEIDGLHAQIALADKTCQQQIKTVKDNARKSKRNWFIAGFVAGIATRVLGHF